MGLETTPGTPVSPIVFPKWSELSLQGVAEKTMDGGGGVGGGEWGD